MTREQLDAIRARIDDGFPPPSSLDTALLLAEVERLRDAHAMAVQVSGELCEKCGWAMRFPGEKCRCELLAEVERLTAERETFWRVLSRVSEFLDGCVGCDTPSICFGATRNMKAEVQDALVGLSHIGILEYAAFQRGVAAMREAAANLFQGTADKAGLAAMPTWAEFIRSLPDPEDKP